ncbi:MAG TPA: PAS domain S-box protein [Thiothrix sp.]|nr:PAS domain S-box protein [Thiothrix sp.]
MSRLLFLFIFLSFPFLSFSFVSNAFIRIGVLNHQGLENKEVIRMWNPTADYLAMKLPQYDFEIIPLGFYEIEAAVGQNNVDFILTNPAIFINLQARNWVTPLATRNNAVGDGTSYNIFGSVIFTKSNRDDINTLYDLKGKHFSAVNETSLGGYQMAWREMKQQGLTLNKMTTKLTFENSHYQVVLKVLNGQADAGTVRTDTLESLYADGIISPDSVKVLNAKKSANFPLLHSTSLYPEWPFSKVNHIDEVLAEQVALTLVRMPLDDPARIPAGYSRWSLPKDYTEVHNLLKELHLPPYALSNSFTWQDAMERYRYWVLGSLFLVLLLLGTSSSLMRRNKYLKNLKRRLERQNKLILNSVSDGIYGVDKQGNCTFVNQAMQDMTGWQAKELINQPIYPLLHHTHKDGNKAQLEDSPMYASLKDDQSHFTSDDIFWRKDGNSIAVEYSTAPIKGRSANTIGVVIVFRDITQRKKAQEKTKQHQLQLAHVARLSTLGEMASGIAHELNQPLTAISTNSRACIRILEAEASSPSIEACADAMEKVADQAERAGQIIKHIRHFVHKELPEKKPVAIKTIIATVTDLLHSDLQRHAIKLQLKLADPDIHVLVQQIQIEQVIINLTRNAVESLEDTSLHQRNIIIQTSHQTKTTENTGNSIIEKVEIRVTDTGNGLSSRIQEQLFDPFITTKTQGMGLGLSISQGIVEAHGDRIRVQSSNKGASFYFYLPYVAHKGDDNVTK